MPTINLPLSPTLPPVKRGRAIWSATSIFLIGVLVAALLTACQTPPPTALNLISYGQVIKGKLGLNENHYIFQGDKGDVVDVECSVDGLPFLVVVLDAGNNVLTQSSGSFALPNSGQYTIVVTTGTGDYTLSLNLVGSGSPSPMSQPSATKPPSPTPTATMQAVLTLPITGIPATIDANIPPSQTTIPTSLLMVTPSPFPTLTPTSATPTLAATMSDTIGPLAGAPTPTATDIPPTDQLSATSTIAATPTPIPMIAATTGAQIFPGQTITGTLAAAGQTDQFIFFGPANSIISIGMFPLNSGLVPAVDVFAPDGTKVGTAAGVAKLPQAIINGLILTQSGAYIIYMHSVSGTGGYSLTVGQSWTLRDVGGGILQPNQAYIGTLMRPGDRETWTVQLQTDNVISIEALPRGGKLDPVIEVLDPNDTRIATGHDFSALNDAKVSMLRVKTAGQYKIRITAYANASIGQYTIVVRLPGN